MCVTLFKSLMIALYVTKTESGVVNPSRPKFYKHFADDIINRRNENQPDDLLQKLNNNHPIMKYTVEVKPEKFFDTKISNVMKESYRSTGHQMLRNGTKGMLSLLI